jgi:hypothetical protein
VAILVAGALLSLWCAWLGLKPLKCATAEAIHVTDSKARGWPPRGLGSRVTYTAPWTPTEGLLPAAPRPPWDSPRYRTGIRQSLEKTVRQKVRGCDSSALTAQPVDERMLPTVNGHIADEKSSEEISLNGITI